MLQQPAMLVVDEAFHRVAAVGDALAGRGQPGVARVRDQPTPCVIGKVLAHCAGEVLARRPGLQRRLAQRCRGREAADRIAGGVVQQRHLLAEAVVARFGDRALRAHFEAQQVAAAGVVDVAGGERRAGLRGAGAIGVGQGVERLPDQAVQAVEAARDGVAAGVAAEHLVAVAVVVEGAHPQFGVGDLGDVAAGVVGELGGGGDVGDGRPRHLGQAAGRVDVVAGHRA
jgi:hypothetical protein